MQESMSQSQDSFKSLNGSFSQEEVKTPIEIESNQLEIDCSSIQKLALKAN